MQAILLFVHLHLSTLGEDGQVAFVNQPPDERVSFVDHLHFFGNLERAFPSLASIGALSCMLFEQLRQYFLAARFVHLAAAGGLSCAGLELKDLGHSGCLQRKCRPHPGRTGVDDANWRSHTHVVHGFATHADHECIYLAA